MEILKKPNVETNWICPICKTAETKEVVLIEIDSYNDKNKQIKQIHLCCLDLRIQRKYLGEADLIYQTIESSRN